MIIHANPRKYRDSFAPTPSLKEDGSSYRFRMFFEGGRKVADSDNLVELTGLLIPNYESLPAEGRELARMNYAMIRTAMAKAGALGKLPPEQISSLEEWEVEVLSREPSDVRSFRPEHRDLKPGTYLDVWHSEIPLLLVEGAYRPWTDTTPPVSVHGDYRDTPNLWWVRHGSDLDFLVSMSKLGVVEFGRPSVSPRIPRNQHDPRNRNRPEADAEA